MIMKNHDVDWIVLVFILRQNNVVHMKKMSPLANLMYDGLKGQFYLLTTNHITLCHLSSKNSIYAKL